MGDTAMKKLLAVLLPLFLFFGCARPSETAVLETPVWIATPQPHGTSTVPSPAPSPVPSPEPPNGYQSFLDAIANRRAAVVDYVIESSNRDSLHYGRNVMDSDASTCWTALDGDEAPGIGFQFDDVYVIDGIVLLCGDQSSGEAYGSGEKTARFSLVFDDQSVETFEVISGFGQASAAIFPPRAARAVMLLSDGAQALSISQIAFIIAQGEPGGMNFAWEPDDLPAGGLRPPETAADGRITPGVSHVEQSSSLDSRYYGENAVDGKDETEWVTMPSDKEGAWLRVYFDKEYAVSEVVVTYSQQAKYAKPRDFELLYDNGESVFIRLSPDGDGSTGSIALEPVETAWVELQVVETEPGDGVAVAEIVFLCEP